MRWVLLLSACVSTFSSSDSGHIINVLLQRQHSRVQNLFHFHVLHLTQQEMVPSSWNHHNPVTAGKPAICN